MFVKFAITLEFDYDNNTFATDAFDGMSARVTYLHQSKEPAETDAMLERGHLPILDGDPAAPLQNGSSGGGRHNTTLAEVFESRI